MRAAAAFAGLLAFAAVVCAAENVVVPTADPAAPQLPAEVFRPEGAGPFPAIVMAHDCSGLGRTSSGAPRRWARELSARGYVVILPDSFTPRGHPGGICTVPPLERHPGTAPRSRAADAYATLAYLRTLTYVDAGRVGLMGGSHGGATTLTAMAEPKPGEPGFRAGLALYPACAVRMGTWNENLTGVYAPAGPVRILVGEADDWTPALNCRRLAEAAQSAGHPVTLKVYPGAHHSFDSANPVRYVATRVNANAPGRRGATTGGHAEAWADSLRDVPAFFDQHLGR